MTLRLALAACLALGACAQTSAPPVSADTTTQAIYFSLLHRVERIEKLADRVEAAGKDPQHANRKWLQKQTGLTDNEFALVRPIVLDAISATNANRAQATVTFQQAQQANAGGPLTAAQKQAIGALNAQGEQLVLTHVQQLEAALGSTRFQQFDSAVRKLIGPSLKVFPLGPKK